MNKLQKILFVIIISLLAFITVNTLLPNLKQKVVEQLGSYFASIILTDAYNFNVENTPMGEMRVIEPFRLVGATFNGTVVDLNFWTASSTGTGTSTSGNAQVILSTGATANSSSTLQTVRTARYIGGSSQRFRAVIRFPDTGTTSNTRKWGAFSTTDGAYFKLVSSTLSVCTFKTGVETCTASGSFNGNVGASLAIDTTVHTWEIYWTNSKVWFVYGDVILHTFSASSTTWSDTMNLPVRFENYNSGGGTSNVSMNVRTATIYRMGFSKTETIWYHTNTAETKVLKYGPGKLHGITVNSPGGATDTFTAYDNTTSTGSIIGVIAVGKNGQPATLSYNDGVPFYTGLTIVSVGSTDITVSYE